MKKIFQILLFVVMILSFLPLDGFCADPSAEHNCVLVCHTCCHHVIPPSNQTPSIAVPPMFTTTTAYSLSFENPTILVHKRPPIISA